MVAQCRKLLAHLHEGCCGLDCCLPSSVHSFHRVSSTPTLRTLEHRAEESASSTTQIPLNSPASVDTPPGAMPPTPRPQPRAAAASDTTTNSPYASLFSRTTGIANLNLNLPRQQQQQPSHHHPRADTPTIPSYYGALHSSPDPGTVAGITLGAVGGFVLFLWLIYTCINLGNPSSGITNDTSTVVTEGTASVYTRRSSRRRRERERSAKETVEIRRSRGGRGGGGPVIVEEVSSVGGSSGMPDRVIIEETSRRRSVSRARGPPGPPPPPPMMRRVGSSEGSGSEDEVVVIEEHSPPRRQRSRIRSVERRSSGYREVDPDRFAGGDASFVEVRRSGSHHRR